MFNCSERQKLFPRLDWIYLCTYRIPCIFKHLYRDPAIDLMCCTAFRYVVFFYGQWFDFPNFPAYLINLNTLKDHPKTMSLKIFHDFKYMASHMLTYS